MVAPVDSFLILAFGDIMWALILVLFGVSLWATAVDVTGTTYQSHDTDTKHHGKMI